MASNPLQDVVPPKYRQVVYALLTLALLAFSLWQASQGDWTLFAGSLLTALGTGTAASNPSPEHPDPAVENPQPLDFP